MLKSPRCAIVRGAPSEGITIIKEVVERIGREMDHHCVELELEGDRHSMEFKDRSGSVIQGKDLVEPHG